MPTLLSRFRSLLSAVAVVLLALPALATESTPPTSTSTSTPTSAPASPPTSTPEPAVAPTVAPAPPPATTPAPAPAATPAAPAPTPDLVSNLGQMLFGLAVVIALLFAGLWAVKRLSVNRGGGTLKVLGAASIGPRERVVLVEVGDKVLVLGVAPGNVRTLHVMESSEFVAEAAVAPAAGGKDFAAWLKQSLERR